MIDTLKPENLWEYIEYQTFQSGELIDLEADFYWLIQQGQVKCSISTETLL